jgi:hypothetical protein
MEGNRTIGQTLHAIYTVAVIPAKAGIQFDLASLPFLKQSNMDPRFRGDDDLS